MGFIRHTIYSVQYLVQIVLVFCTLCSSTGRAGWHDARVIVREADSMDVHGVLYEDTAALRQVINTWEKPILRPLMHDDLGKAYYYLGRNKEDRFQQYTEAAKCYIRSDRLHMSDPGRRGKVSTCMENLKTLDIPVLEAYLNPPLFRMSDTLMATIICAVLLACTLVGVLDKRVFRSRLSGAEQHASDLENRLAGIRLETEERQAEKRDAVETALWKNRGEFALDSPVWGNDDMLCRTADRQLYNIYTRLHSRYAVDMQDFRICMLTLYGASRAQIAARIFRAVSSVPKLRANTAKKLGTTSSQLRTFLIDFMAS